MFERIVRKKSPAIKQRRDRTNADSKTVFQKFDKMLFNLFWKINIGIRRSINITEEISVNLYAVERLL
jgi:hypothetical protein